AAEGDKARILDFNDDQMARANTGTDLWTRYVIPANTYPGQAKDVNTIAQPNFLGVHKDVPEEDVYMITKAIYENLAFLNGIHKATSVMKLESAIGGLPAPLHPGAARYYKEAGLTIPDRLIAK
ncbi:MAG: TAXI family TRAP transporter solute-binding subunit, partial [Rhodospirillales bacterium]|nr:TAXI family TRAP transporter solute-binding subunit [Rhodospirillales bacterium]